MPRPAAEAHQEHGVLAAVAVRQVADQVDPVRQPVLELALGRRRERVEVDVDVALDHGAQPPRELGPSPASACGSTR